MIKKFFRPILIFYKAQYKIQSKEKIGFILSLSTPILYASVFAYQIIINYSLKPHPFSNLPIWTYFSVFFSLQMIHFLSFDQSIRQLVGDILRGEYDYHLMRPVNLWYFKYMRAPSLLGLTQTWLYFTCLCISIYHAKLSAFQILTLFLFIYSAAYVLINIKATLRGLVFFKRDILSTTMLEEAIVVFATNKPPEIFPQIILAIGTVILPIFVIHSNLFDAIRGINLLWVMGWLLWWMLLATYLNHLVWAKGSKKYESG